MPQTEALKTITDNLKSAVADARAAFQKEKDEEEANELEKVQRILLHTDIPGQIRSGRTYILVMNISEDSVRKEFFSEWHWEKTGEHRDRIKRELQKCQPADLTAAAARVFEICQQAGLNPRIELQSGPEVPYIVVG